MAGLADTRLHTGATVVGDLGGFIAARDYQVVIKSKLVVFKVTVIELFGSKGTEFVIAFGLFRRLLLSEAFVLDEHGLLHLNERVVNGWRVFVVVRFVRDRCVLVRRRLLMPRVLFRRQRRLLGAWLVRVLYLGVISQPNVVIVIRLQFLLSLSRNMRLLIVAAGLPLQVGGEEPVLDLVFVDSAVDLEHYVLFESLRLDHLDHLVE